MEQESAPIRALPRNVRLLGAASLVNDIASEMIYPLMPAFLLTLARGNRFDLGVIEGVAETVASLLKLWSGAWSDRRGRRKGFVVVGYALAAVTRPLIGVATVPWQVFASRTADRVGKGLRTSPRDALIADSTPPELRGTAYGFHRGMDHLGAAIGPLLAAAFLILWPGELRLLFLLTLFPGLAVVALLWWGLKEPENPSPPPLAERLALRAIDGNFRLYLVSVVVFTLGNSSDAFLLVRAGELGVPPAMLPLLWCVFHVVKSVGNVLAGRAVDVIGARPMIFMGWTVYAAIYLAFAVAAAVWHVWGLFLLYGLFYALTEPAEKTLVTQLVGYEKKGAAFGWFHFATGVAALPSSVVFGWLYERFGVAAAFGCGAALAGVAAALLTGVSVPVRKGPVA